MGNITIESLRQQVRAGKSAEDQLIALLTEQARGDQTSEAASTKWSIDAAEAEEELTKLLLDRIQRGGKAARDQLFHQVRSSMREKAGQLLPKNNATIQPTVLVDDAFVDLLNSDNVDWVDRKHFLSFAAGRMTQMFIDYKRRRSADKRGGGQAHADVAELEIPVIESETDFETRLRVLKMLRDQERTCYEVILLRFYAGLTVDEVAGLLGVHPNTVKNKTQTALAVLKAELADSAQQP